MSTWEERMSQKHRGLPTWRGYPVDPIPMRPPTLKERWYWQILYVGRWIKYPRPRCRTCSEWRGEWKLDENDQWVVRYGYWMVCDPFGWRTGERCPHFHHRNDIALAAA